VLTLLLLILLGIIDFGRLLFVQQAVKSASREGARAAVVDSGTGTVVFNAANNSASAAAALAGGGGALVIRALPPGSAPGTILPGSGTATDGSLANTAMCPASTSDAVSVTVTVNFRWLTPVGALPGLSAPGLTGTKPVDASTTMRCE